MFGELALFDDKPVRGATIIVNENDTELLIWKIKEFGDLFK